jgi:hypothetical protein
LNPNENDESHPLNGPNVLHVCPAKVPHVVGIFPCLVAGVIVHTCLHQQLIETLWMIS